MWGVGRSRTFDVESFVDVAAELFWTDGYRNTSLVEIASATGVSNGSIYAAYGSKRALYLEALRRYCSRRTELVRNAVAAHASPVETVAALLTAIIEDCVAQPRRRGCFLLNTIAEFDPSDEEIQSICRDANAEMEHDIADALRAIGAVPPADPASADALAAQILLVAQGLIQLSRIGIERAQLADISDSYCVALHL